MRRGFTLIETLVALVLLEIGLLALVASSAVAARDLAFAQRSARAQSLSRNRLELVRAEACSTATGGSATSPGGFTESWTVRTHGEVREVRITVAFVLQGGRPGRIELRSGALCPP